MSMSSYYPKTVASQMEQGLKTESEMITEIGKKLFLHEVLINLYG